MSLSITISPCLQPIKHILKFLRWAARFLLWVIVQMSLLPAEAYGQMDDYRKLNNIDTFEIS